MQAYCGGEGGVTCTTPARIKKGIPFSTLSPVRGVPCAIVLVGGWESTSAQSFRSLWSLCASPPTDIFKMWPQHQPFWSLCPVQMIFFFFGHI